MSVRLKQKRAARHQDFYEKYGCDCKRHDYWKRWAR